MPNLSQLAREERRNRKAAQENAINLTDDIAEPNAGGMRVAVTMAVLGVTGLVFLILLAVLL